MSGKRWLRPAWQQLTRALAFLSCFLLWPFSPLNAETTIASPANITAESNDLPDEQEVIYLSNSEWPPYFSEKLKHAGVGSHIVSDAFALEGIKVKYEFFPARRAFELAKSGSFVGTVGWELNKQREAFFIASNTMWTADWVFFHLKSNPFDWQSFSDLSSIQVGSTAGYMYTEDFLQAVQRYQLNIDLGSSDDQGFRKLMAGRFDVFPQLEDVGYFQIRALFTEDAQTRIIHHPKPFGAHEDQLLLSKNNARSEQLMKVFNRGLAKLKASGKFEEYFAALRRGEYEFEKSAP